MTDQTQSSHTDQKLLLDYLAIREDHCPSCDYNIHKITSDTCPECGEALKLQVAMKTPKLAAFVVGLIALSISAGFPLLFAALITIIYFIDNPGPGFIQIVTSSLAFFALLCVPIYIWYRNRSKLIRSNNHARWFWACITWFSCPVSLLTTYIILEYFQ
ncbi:hypothetical protein JD969_07755 [Planctomycetota bacterium]|nr:hypothetical protein JD969_07755 [Planctomycetota bacterium]